MLLFKYYTWYLLFYYNSEVLSPKIDLSNVQFTAQFPQYWFCVECSLVPNINQLEDKSATINTKSMWNIKFRYNSAYHNTIRAIKLNAIYLVMRSVIIKYRHLWL